MKTNNVEFIELAYYANVPSLFWGDPGTGKSSTFTGFGLTAKKHVEIITGNNREPSDFVGMPMREGAGVIFAPPAWALRLAANPGSILFIDEISTAPPAVQAALLRVIFERVVGELQLPEDVRIFAAANPPELAASGWELSYPLANRFVHKKWSVNAESFLEGFVSGFPLPDLSRVPERVDLVSSKTLVTAFLRSRPHLIVQIPKNLDPSFPAFPTMRTWEFAAKLHAFANALSSSEETKIEAVSGAVGTGTAHEFLAYERDLDLPDPLDVLANYKKFKLPARQDKAFAILTSVAATAVAVDLKKYWIPAWEIMATATKGAPDLAAIAARTLAVAARGNKDLDISQIINQIESLIPILKEAGIFGGGR